MTDACMDCHSNLTKWPWYSNVAPISWLVQGDVEDLRRALNLSTGEAGVEETVEAPRGIYAAVAIQAGPPGGKAVRQEKRDLIRGLQATCGGASGDGAGGGSGPPPGTHGTGTSTKIRLARPRIEEVWG